MPIDPSIAMGVRPLEVPNPLAQYGQVMQIQAAQRQGEVSQMQMDELKRDREGMLKFQANLKAKGGNPDLDQYASMLLQSDNAAHQKMGIELKQKLMQQAQFEKIMSGGAPTAAPASAQAGALGSGAYDALPVPTNALAPAPAAPANALAAPNVAALRQKRDQFLAMGTTQSIAAARALDADIALASREPVYHNVPNVGLVDPRTRQTIVPAVETKPNEQKLYELAVSQGFPGTFRDFHLQNIREGRAPAQPRPEQPPVAVVDNATGKTVYVSREEALKGRMTPASALEGLPPKEIQKREAAYPAATSAIESVEASADSLISDMQKLRDHPGLSGITGIAAGRLPGVTDAGRAAKTLYDKIVAKGGFQMLQELRNASKTGGALGNISNQEGSQLKSAFAAIDRTQNADDIRKALDEAITTAQGSKSRMRETYDRTYEYKAGAKATAPAVANGVDTSNPLLR